MTERSGKVHHVAKNSMYLKTSSNMTLNSDFTLCLYWEDVHWVSLYWPVPPSERTNDQKEDFGPLMSCR